MTRHEMIELLGWHHRTMTDEQRDMGASDGADECARAIRSRK